MKKVLFSMGMLCITLSSNAQTFEWARNMGNTLNTIGRTIGVDNLGNVYTVGTFNGTADMDPSNLAVDLVTSVGSDDIFISKLNSKGEYVWSKTIGGAGTEMPYHLKVDGAGNLYLTGSFEGTVDFNPGSGVNNLVSNGMSDIFLLKLNNAGDFVWANGYGGPMEDLGASIATNSTHVFLTGSFKDEVNFDPSGTTKKKANGIMDIFAMKLNPSGSTVWVQTIGGSGEDEGKSIGVDSKGEVVISGYFNGSVDFNPGPTDYFKATDGFVRDVFILKLAVDGSFKWVKVIGSKSFDGAQTTLIDASDAIYTVGYFGNNVDFDPGSGFAYISSGTTTGAFVQKLTVNGDYVWAKGFNGQLLTTVQCAALDKLGNIFVTGFFSGSIDFGAGSGLSGLTSSGSEDAFIVKMMPDGKYACANKIGGSKYDNGYAITLNNSNELYGTGSFSGTADFDPGVNVANLLASTSGVSDAYTVKLSNFPAGIREHSITENNLLRVFPNPSSGKLTLSLMQNEPGSYIEIMDIYGKTVYSLQDLNARNDIDLQGFGAGMYFVKLIQEGEVVSGAKIIIQ